MGMDCPLYTPLGEWPGGNVRIMYSPCCDDGFKLLGRPYMIEVNEEYDDDFVSVLQVDGNDDWGMRFYDCGMLFLLMRKSQLLGRDWERTFGNLFSF